MSANRSGRTKVSIRPGVEFYATLSRLSYQPWYALAEFVDNSIQSFLDNRPAIQALDGKKAKLRVQILYDATGAGKLTIRDNAGGISDKAFPRAFKPAEFPVDRSGLHEYGMGMKSAACWFSPVWTVHTKQINKAIRKTVHFDIESIIEDKIEELDVTESASKPNEHYTEIVLTKLHRSLAGRTIGKVKSHLASIFRHFLKEGWLEIDFDGVLLSYEPPKILRAPHHKTSRGPEREWRKEFSINLGAKKRAHGFAAIREVGSTTEAGFAIFRKNRLVLGSHDQTWRPSEIFGPSNKHRYQRIFGEIHLEGFQVSHTKDAVVWENHEEEFISKIRSELTKGSLDLLDQAEWYRPRASSDNIAVPAAKALQKFGAEFTRDLGKIIEKSRDKARQFKAQSGAPPKRTTSPKRPKKPQAEKTFEIRFREEEWAITIRFLGLGASQDLIRIVDAKRSKGSAREQTITLNTDHNFYQNHVGTDPKAIEVFLRLSASLAIAETVAQEGGVPKASLVRSIVGDVLQKI
jgi:hypothetical protein